MNLNSNPITIIPGEDLSMCEPGIKMLPYYKKKLKFAEFDIEASTESDLGQLFMINTTIDFFYSLRVCHDKNRICTKVSMLNFTETLCLKIK